MSEEKTSIVYIEDSDADFFLFKKQIDNIEFQEYTIDHIRNFSDLTKHHFQFKIIRYLLYRLHT